MIFKIFSFRNNQQLNSFLCLLNENLRKKSESISIEIDNQFYVEEILKSLLKEVNSLENEEGLDIKNILESEIDTDNLIVNLVC